MSLKLICGPAGSGKTALAIDIFLRALDEDRNPVFIAPSVPDARHFERQILRRRSVMTAGAVTTFNHLLRDLGAVGEGGKEARGKSAPDILSPPERFQLLKEIIRKRPPEFLAASSIFDGFIADLAELTSELMALGVEPARFGQAMRSLARGDSWKQGLNQDLFRIFEEYRSLLAELHLQDPDEAERQAVEILKNDPGALPYGSVIVDGFWDFTPLEMSLVEALQSSGRAELAVTLPHHDLYPVFDPVASLYRRLAVHAEVLTLEGTEADDRRPALRHLSRFLFQPEAEAVPAGGAVATLKAAADRGQAELVAAEILKLHRGGVELDNVAVVTRSYGEDAVALASALKDFGVPFEFSAPVPLPATAVGETAAAALRLLLPEAGRDDLLAFLRGPLATFDPDRVDDFDRAARGSGRVTDANMFAEWERFDGSPLAISARLAPAAAQGMPALAGGLVNLLREMMLGSAQRRLEPQELDLNIRALRELVSVCDITANLSTRLAELGQEIGPRERETAAGCAHRLSEALAQAMVRPASGARRGCVRLLDPHRVLNQRFDVVFICGLLEGRFPFMGGENAFLDDGDRALLLSGAGLPLAARDNRLQEERFLFYRTLTRARHKVYLCYPYCDQEGKPTINSLLVDDVLDLLEPGSWEKVEKRIGDVTFTCAGAPTAGQALLSLCLSGPGAAAAADAAVLERLRGVAGPASLAERLLRVLESAAVRPPMLGDDVKKRLGEREFFRVTELEHYLRCPFSYFLDYVIRAAPLDAETFALDRGSAAHEILPEFFAALSRGGVFLPDADAGELREARRIMTELIGEHFGNGPLDIQSLVIKTHLLGHLERFIDRERTCRPEFRPYKFEWSFGICDGPPGGRFDEETMLKFGDIKLCGRMDRVDLRQGKAQAIVIDYKTSADRNLPAQKKFAESAVLQVPIYMMALRDIWGLEPLGGEYYGILGSQRRGVYLKEYGDVLGARSGELTRTDFVDAGEFAAEMDSARSRAVQAAEGIRAGEFPCAPLTPQVCENCGREALCRLPETRDLEVEQES